MHDRLQAPALLPRLRQAVTDAESVAVLGVQPQAQQSEREGVTVPASAEPFLLISAAYFLVVIPGCVALVLAWRLLYGERL